MNIKQKKLISILKKLSPYRPSAEWLIALLSTKKIDDHSIENIIELISSSLEEFKTTKNAAKLQQTSKKIKQIKQEVEKEQSEAENILLDL